MKFKFKHRTYFLPVMVLQMLFLFQAFSIDKQFILNKTEGLTPDEKKYLTSFFKICFCSYEFGYTIFGEKPMSIDTLDLIRPSIEDSAYKDDEWTICEYRKKEGWEVWKKHFQDVPLDGFSLIFYPAPNRSELIYFYIINHKNFLRIVEKNLEDFQKVLNRKITSNDILNEYKKGEGEIFNTIENHDGMLGILLGFGKENSFKFMNKEKLSPSVDPMSLKGLGMEDIGLPCFMVSEGSSETKEIMASYAKQRVKINEIYRKENFLEVVLMKLFCSDSHDGIQPQTPGIE